MSKNYELTMQTNPMCPKRTEIIDAINKANEDGSGFKAKVVLGGEKTVIGQFPICIDTVSDGNRFAVVKEVRDGDKSLSDDEIAEIAGCEYTIQVKQVNPDGKTITAEIVIEKAKAIVAKATKASPEVDAAVAEKVAAGIITQEEADRKVEVMLKNYVDENLMLQVIRGWKTYKKHSHRLRCEYVDPYLEDRRKQGRRGLIAKALRNAVNRYAIIEEGEKSVGKNVFVETIAWLMNMPLYLITFSRNMSPSSVYGEKSTDNTASEYFKTTTAERATQAKLQLANIEKQMTEIRGMFRRSAELNDANKYTEAYIKLVNECGEKGDISILTSEGGVDAQVLKIFYGEDSGYAKTMDLFEKRYTEMQTLVAELDRRSAQAQSVNIIIDSSELYDWLTIGGLMVFNEMNMAEPNFFASFSNQLTDGTGFLFIPGRGEVKISEDCVLCGTQNADYEGVEQQNEATMSRFGCSTFEQPKTIKNQLIAAVQTELKAKGYTQALDTKSIDLIEKFYKICQKAVNKGDFTNAVLNIRGFVRAMTNVISSDGNALLIEEVEDHVINTCPVDERQPLASTASTIFGGF
jgi:MoxR-like ATPase